MVNPAAFKLDLAVVIGINDYGNGVPVLGTARQDAAAIAQILETEYHYQVHLITDNTATLANLKRWLEKELPALLNASSASRLLFYFAGHGIALNGDEGPQGYLIPQDATLGNVATYLPMQQVEQTLTQLACRHCLVILDCCFAGAFRWSSTRRLVPVAKVLHKERFDRFIQDPAWQVITSAAADQSAADSLALHSDRGIAPGPVQHSPFAAALMAALRGAADAYPPATRGKAAGDGVITATELYLYLRDAVEVPTDALHRRQTPQIWCLKKHDKGEFIFLPPGHALNLPPAPSLTEVEAHNPYQGLKSYETQDSALFFGRTALIEKLCDAMGDRPLTVVLGASGSGKSSLVKAGLIPHLQGVSAAAPAGSAPATPASAAAANRSDLSPHADSHRCRYLGWQILTPIRPGESPLNGLNQALRELVAVNTDWFDTAQKGDRSYTTRIYRAAIAAWSQAHPATKILLVIDQWEELLTLCHQEPERQLFFAVLADLLQAHGEVLRVVVTLRSDFEPQFRSTPLEGFWSAARFVVPAMTRDELRAVIEAPAAAKVVYFESLERRGDLVDQLIDEVAGMPGALPLLSFALSELYLKLARRYLAAQTTGETVERAITWADYDQLGGVTKSLTRRADEEYDALVQTDAAYGETIRQVMLRMVAVGGELARRQAAEAELRYPEPENTRIQTVIQRFATARLLVRGTDIQDQPYIEPAHDALVRGWERLLDWKQAAAENLILQRRLTPAASEWERVKIQEQAQASGLLARAKPVIYGLDRRLFAIENGLNYLLTQARRGWRRSRPKSTGADARSLSPSNPESDAKSGAKSGTRSGQFLWNSNPYLEVLQNALTTNNHWLNQVETEFVQESILQKRRNRSWRWRIAISVILGLSGLTLAALIGQRAALINQIQASRQSAEANFRGGQLLNASLDSLRAAQSLNHPLLKLFPPTLQLRKEVIGTLQKAIYSAQERNRLHLDQGIVRSTMSADGKLIASGGEDGIVALWSPQGQQKIHWNTQQGAILNLSFSPDGQQLATAGSDNTVRLWNSQGQPGAILRGHTQMVKGLSFRPDGQRLATSGKDKTIRLWNLQGQQLAVFTGHQDDVWGVAFSPDGRMLASASDDGTFRLWNLQGKQLRQFKAQQGDLHNIKFSPDGQRLATTGEDGRVRLWTLGGMSLAILQGHRGRVWNVVFSPDGQQLASAAADGTVRLWNLQGQPLVVWRGHQGPVRTVSFSPDGQHLVSSGDDSTVRLWSLQGQSPVILSGHQGPVRAIAFNPTFNPPASPASSPASSPKLPQLATGGEDATIRLWRGAGPGLATLRSDRSAIRAIAFSPNGQQLASAQGQTVRLWPVQSYGQSQAAIAPQSEFQGHQGLVRSVQFSPDGQLLASAGDDGTIRLWNLQGQPLADWKVDQTRVWEVAFSPDGQRLASAGADGMIRLWNRQGQPLGQLAGHLGPVYSVAFSPDGQQLASAGQDGTIRMWDLQTQRKIQLYHIDNAANSLVDEEVNSVAFSPDGQFLVSGDNLGNVQLWDLQFQQQFAAWTAHRNSIVRQVRFSPDGQQVATVADDGMAKVWTLASFDALIASSCTLLGDYLQLRPNPELRPGDRPRCAPQSPAISP